MHKTERMLLYPIDRRCIGIARASETRLGRASALLSMTRLIVDATKAERHPEERPKGASRRTHGGRAILRGATCGRFGRRRPERQQHESNE